ncbi:MAG: hypothetical protein ABIR46_01060 [Candidatus Saccharimonadales bacterium]
MMQFRVEMTKQEFLRIIQRGPGESHAIRFGRDADGAFKADRSATLVFDSEAEEFTTNTDCVRSLLGTVTDGKRSLKMILTLYPKYGVRGIVNMKPIQSPKSRHK